MNGEARAFVFGMVGVTGALAVLLVIVYGVETERILQALAGRSSLLITGTNGYRGVEGGFAINVLISLWAMVAALAAGVLLGIGLISQSPVLRGISSLLMNILRNSPWLVVLYAMLYLLPFEITLFGSTVFLSPTLKATAGLALPVTANIAEVFRGSVESIPSGQWESARSLGYRRLQILRHVIVPQAIPIALPNLMTTYAMLFIGTGLVVVTGAQDVLSMARTVIASDGDHYATAIYLFILLLFFLYCFPIAIFSRWLERRVSVPR